MDIEAFYKDKKKVTRSLATELVEKQHKGQPPVEMVYDEDLDRDVVYSQSPVYITSVTNRDKGIKGDVVTLATFDNACYRITDGTHRVATAAEIESYLHKQLSNLRESEVEDIRMTTSRHMTVTQDDLAKVPQHLQHLVKKAAKVAEPAPSK